MATDLPLPLSKPTSPPRPKHQTTRSITETSLVPKLHRPHHHHPHIHRHHHKEKDKDKGGGSASENANSYLGADGGTKSEGVTPDESQVGSRRDSFITGAGMGTMEIDGLVVPASWREERRGVREGEVLGEKERGVIRATELRNALNNLNTLSNNHTRRLDNTYYSVLEKLSALQSTVSSLKELAGMTRELKGEFEEEAKEVLVEIEGSLGAFKGFTEQEERIESLMGRVREGREKIKTLGDRVEVVKGKVDGWERNELEWQERTRRRLRVLWIIIAVCGVVFLGLVAFQYTPARTQGPGVIKGINASEFGGALPDFLNESWTLKRSSSDALEKLKAKSEEPDIIEEDPRLRVFDEL